MKCFWVLWTKELKDSRLSFFAISGFIVVWNLFLYSRQPFWDQDLILVLSLAPLLILPFYSLISGVTSLSGEWHNQTIMILRSLPLRSITILGVKLLSIFSMVLFFCAINISASMVLGKDLIPPEFSPSLLILITLGTALFMLALALLSQFAYVLSRMVDRLNILVGIWVFLLSLWGLGRCAALMNPLLAHLPKLSFRMTDASISESLSLPALEVNPGPLVAGFLGIAVLFLLGSWLMDNHIEI